MKKIIRLTESDLHGIIQRSVLSILREQNDVLLLQQIAQKLAQGTIHARSGENEEDVELQGDMYAVVRYTVESNPYRIKGMKSHDYDVPNDPDEVVDEPNVIINEIVLCSNNDCQPLQDNGIVKRAIEQSMEIEYDDSIPSEEEFFNEY